MIRPYTPERCRPQSCGFLAHENRIGLVFNPSLLALRELDCLFLETRFGPLLRRRIVCHRHAHSHNVALHRGDDQVVMRFDEDCERTQWPILFHSQEIPQTRVAQVRRVGSSGAKVSCLGSLVVRLPEFGWTFDEAPFSICLHGVRLVALLKNAINLSGSHLLGARTCLLRVMSRLGCTNRPFDQAVNSIRARGVIILPVPPLV